MSVLIDGELLNSNLILKKLKYMKNIYNLRVNQTKEDKKFCDRIDQYIDKIKESIEELNKAKKENDVLYEWKLNFYDMINELADEKQENSLRDKPKTIDFKSYNERAYAKLNFLFRQNKIMSLEEAKIFYCDSNKLHDKYVEFLNLINWLSDNGLNIICEKVLFSGYLNISVETYNELYSKSSESVRNVFKSIDEGFTTMQFGALISDDRKNLNRIQGLKIVSQELEQKQANIQINNNTLNNFTFDELHRKYESVLPDKKKDYIDYKE